VTPASIRLGGVGKTYRTSSGTTRALDGIDLTIRGGAITVLLGPSGCGKTSLLRIVAGLELQTEGEVAGIGDARLGVVFQDANLFPWFRIADNIALPLRLAGMPRSARLARAAELAQLVGLAGFERRYPRELSGGMRQRAAIARALASDPQLVLMDEPFGALDAMTREAMNLETQRIWLRQRCTILLVTHAISEAVFLGDQVVLMSPRPGRVAHITEVTFPRPRDPDLQTTAAFQDIVRDLRHRLQAFAA
jgi:NitT/TauT family transport system ATP-binding protein